MPCWEVYDESHSSDLQLNEAGDLSDELGGQRDQRRHTLIHHWGYYFTSSRSRCDITLQKSRMHIVSNASRVSPSANVPSSSRFKQRTYQNSAAIGSSESEASENQADQSPRDTPCHRLLVARSLCSRTNGLDNPSQTDEDGAIPRGTFNRYMTRDRLNTIMRYLHFTSNSAEAAAADKAWNLRPVLQTLEKAFRRGYRRGPRISFDKEAIPDRCKFSPLRVYNKDKPHKYRTKVYMNYCANSGYCSSMMAYHYRIEVYMGVSKESKIAQTPAKQQATGVAQKAVIRNITKALVGQPGKQLLHIMCSGDLTGGPGLLFCRSRSK